MTNGFARVWHRLLELSGVAVGLRQRQETLVQGHFSGEVAYLRARFRITPLGMQVRAGEVDALDHIPYYRWVGGRQITNDRLLRRDTE